MVVSKVNQRGAIVVMTVFFIIILIGFAALALDLGRLYVLRTEMQNAADAAAIAAAAELDGATNAIYDAKVAAKEALSHQGKFAQNTELLSMLGDNAFEFYSWIGAEGDGPRPLPGDCPTTPEEPNKCLTTDDSNAFYVKVKLYPELVSDGHYKISLFFLPVLNILLGDSTGYEASTRVSAVAGAGQVICNLPPILICDPAEAGQPFVPGQMVVLKEQGSGTWQPGNFGFLQPPKITGNLNKDLAYALANESLAGCNPPYVSTLPGGKSSFGRYGINTRFGIYDTSMQGDKDKFPPAPDVIDYPRDDNLTQLGDLSGTCTFDVLNKFGNNAPPLTNGMLNTEIAGCPVTYGLSASNANLTDNDNDGWQAEIDPNDADATNPSTLTRDPYYNDAYENGEIVPSFGSRYEYYQWELGISPVTPIDPSGTSPANWQWEDQPATLTNNPLLTTVGGTTIQSADCKNVNPTKQACRIRSGDPSYTTPSAPPPGTPKRRIIYVAMLNCQEYGITGSTPNLYIAPPVGRFAKFFLTEHAYPPPAVDFYAEYLGEVQGEELQQLIHTQIQLYE